MYTKNPAPWTWQILSGIPQLDLRTSKKTQHNGIWAEKGITRTEGFHLLTELTDQVQNTYPYLNPKFHLEETVDQSYLVVHRFGELKTKTCELMVEMTVTSKFTQQDGRKKRTTNDYEWQTWQGYYLRVLWWSSLNIDVFWSFIKRTV